MRNVSSVSFCRFSSRHAAPKPASPETFSGGSSLALEGLQIEFYGKNAHAANAPEEGINALDAASLFYQMVNLEKQYYPGSNLYGIMKETGVKSNIIPDLATLQFSVRAWKQDIFLQLTTEDKEVV